MKLNEVVGGLRGRRPDSGLFKITEEDFVEAEAGAAKLKELISSQGLFGGSYIVICENLISASEEVGQMLSQMADSPHVFVFLEGPLSKKDLKLFEKQDAKIQSFDVKTKKEKPFNIFLLADALANKRKKDMWVLYQKALRAGLPPEQIHGMIFWQVKTLLLVALSDGKESVDLKPFVITKAKNALRLWNTAELIDLSSKVVSIYHDARRGGQELKLSLEELIVSV